MLIIAIVVMVVLLVGGMGWQLREREQPPAMNAQYLKAFALAPGERHGTVWRGNHHSGARLVVSITSAGDLVMNHADQDGVPVRVRQATSTAAVGPVLAINGPTEPVMAEVTISSAEHQPFVVYLEPAAASTVANWAARRP
ncbi:hypothetical protein LGT39_12155 [Demequina sp. TTPB684]|uniref:hypothetical protein n=1 Tax=unclassified Demequina TaxID=2620311 RepID=UPI001CF19AE3|nr:MULTISPECIES: hypothetical protein [unclassified Demequina]MCB2413596.1 hypothetical protein [Demequina sp. TTPB684]UPU88551.1 hypothetical protein LGT36_001100 [Demequina sp. TMPB413]